jgi:hypothetical protein
MFAGLHRCKPNEGSESLRSQSIRWPYDRMFAGSIRRQIARMFTGSVRRQKIRPLTRSIRRRCAVMSRRSIKRQGARVYSPTDTGFSTWVDRTRASTCENTRLVTRTSTGRCSQRITWSCTRARSRTRRLTRILGTHGWFLVRFSFCRMLVDIWSIGRRRRRRISREDRCGFAT